MGLIRQNSILLATVLASNLVVAGVQARPTVSCPIRSTTDFVYYSGSGASSLSQSWMVHFLDWWKAQDSSIEYLKLSAAEVAACDMTDATKYPDLDMYIQPGGDAYLAQRAIGASGKSRINAFLASNGSYFGACAGWYFAAKDYMWQDAYYQHPNLLGAYPATVEGSIKEIADYDVGTGYAVASLVRSLDPDQKIFPALYWGGPTRERLYTSNDGNTGNVDAKFSPSELPAVVTSGNMLLTSVHLEAYENDGFTGLTTAEREANYRYLAGLINEVAGTAFLVPGPPEPPQPPPPGSQELFADSFEQGFTWVTSGPGTAWSIRTDNVADGTHSAGVKKTTAGNPSYMTHEIALSSCATLTYTRKLVGLDAGDDFSAEYFDEWDQSWHDLERLGRGSENGGFVDRSFELPATATAIQFMCEAGAVSEGCWVDRVKIGPAPSPCP